MEIEFFSLLWDREAYYKEWLRDIGIRDKEYLYDLHLEYVYDEVCKWGGFGERYDFRDVFLYSCSRESTIEYRQRILERLFEDGALYDIALEAVSCVYEAQKEMARIFRIKDEMRREIFFLQMLEKFLSRMGESYVRLEGQSLIPKGTSVAAGIRKLGEGVTGYETEQQKKRLRDYLETLYRYMPSSLILNKGQNQACHSAVIDPMEGTLPSFTDRLKAAVSFFLDDYEYPVKVYQDMDITCLDKKIQEHVCRQHPGLEENTKKLYEAFITYDFQPFIQLANELTFYLSCVRFRKQYEGQGFPFVLPVCGSGGDWKVEDAYDMVLGINQFREGKGFQAVPNDFRFDGEGHIFLLTGANQGGKTTYIRSVGLVQHLAQIGMFVPAMEAVLWVVGNIHTHFSRDDEGEAATGRFGQEMERMRKLMERLEDGDMVLLNESFTSTRRTEAVTLLCGLLQEFHRRRCVGGAVTHFHEISDRLKEGGFYSLVAEVAKDEGHAGRTFRILRMEPYRQSYAKDIAEKCKVTYGQLLQVIESGEGGGDRDVLF